MRLAVSVVTCRQAEMRTPTSGCVLMNSLRMVCSTGMDWNAHSMRRLPISARARSLISQAICGCVSVAINSSITLARGGFGKGAGGLPQRIGLVGEFPGEAVAGAAEMAEGGRGPVNRAAQLQMLDDAQRGEGEV